MLEPEPITTSQHQVDYDASCGADYGLDNSIISELDAMETMAPSCRV
jgi:hypothetical protein